MTITINNKNKKTNVPNSTDKGNVIRNVPHLRFPEFEGEWEKCKFKDVCSISTGNKNTQDKADDGIYPFYVRSQTVERINSWTFDGEAILTAGDGVGVGKVFHHSYGKIGVHQRVYILSDFKCDANYLFHFFSSKFYNRVKRMSAKNSVDSVRKEMITDMPLSLPCQKEQVKIGHMLSLLDERIATQNKIIDKLQTLIKGIVDSTILRKEKNAIVGDVCSISEQIRAEANIDDIITVRLHGNGVCKSSAENLQLGATQYYRRRAGQLIYGKQNFHNGAIGIVPISLDNGITSKDIPSFDIDEMKCNSVYLLAQLQSPQYYKPAEALTTGTGSKRLKEETFLKMPIVLPNKREQDNIATLIISISANLDQAKKMLDLFSIQKQYLLRQMFI